MHRQNTVTHKNYIQTLQLPQNDDKKRKHIKRYINKRKDKTLHVALVTTDKLKKSNF